MNKFCKILALAFLIPSLVFADNSGIVRINPTTTNPSVANATSVTVLAANPVRRGYRIQNNSAANICCSESGNTLTNITGTGCNVLTPGTSLNSMSVVVSGSAITCYQTSGGAITTITVTEWS